MTTNIKIYSENDINKIVKEQVQKRFYSFERLLNSLKTRVDDLDKMFSNFIQITKAKKWINYS